MNTLIKPIGVGIIFVIMSAVGGLIADRWLEWGWIAATSLILAVVVALIVGLAVVDSGHPPTWGGGFWSSYTEMLGRGSVGGGLRDMTRPPGGWQFSVLASAMPPTVAFIFLIAVALL